ncbi:P-loop containing nucleoside triphosphate hydrolase protein [Rhizodiscina lignyota]|uniref:P-loop containing nucleoside triphosphate hydrolase protein n=1 Tax=Rhizodiscina lignyota TaxID=1504668 RepID=A0A9P4IDI0_9PEZI|nr:P-loop containing nucleoside triphosphate hydrolase protein [Rhizodiscina lignyota]
MSTTLEEWYQNAYTRRVDLVGDYAGAELFLVEGDSILLHEFSDPHLDFNDNGFQLLHAAYNVEFFLKRLIARNCKFHVAFFDDHEELCVPATATASNRQKYLLARAAIIRHLKLNVTDEFPTFTFPSASCTEFQEYLQDTGMYFVMCHDGAHSSDASKSHLRYFMHFLVARGYNIALLNGIEFHDSKIMTLVLEDRRHGADFPRPPRIYANGADTTNSADTTSVNKNGINALLKLGDEQLSEREVLSLLCLAQLSKENAIPAEAAFLFIFHTAILAHAPLAGRCFISENCSPETVDLVNRITNCASALLKVPEVVQYLDNQTAKRDLVDFIDVRLLTALSHHKDWLFAKLVGSGPVVKRFQMLASVLKKLLAANELPPAAFTAPNGEAVANGISTHIEPSQSARLISILPFAHPVFDGILSPIHLSIDTASTVELSTATSQIFSELSHWHNSKKPLVQQGHQVQKLTFWANKRNQRFMAEMTAYAASLTNAAGKVLEPETIIVKSGSKPSSSSQKENRQPAKKEAKSGAKPGATNKKGGKAAALEAAATTKAKKVNQEEAKFFSAWDSYCREFQKVDTPVEKYIKADKYLNGLSKQGTAVVGSELELFKMICLFDIWVESRSKVEKNSATKSSDTSSLPAIGYIAIIWDIATRLSRDHSSTAKTVAVAINDMLSSLGLPTLTFTEQTSARQLPFKVPFASKTSKSKQPNTHTSISQDPRVFQVQHCGPYFDRSFDAAPDARVPFQPDGWQRRVLDAIDEDKSLLVLAPTSAGKTFISFYAMKQVLEADDDGVLVYVAPTKALVNQIAAEVQARFSKNIKHAGRSVWGIHTRDYRINNPTGCQVLVTVPHILQIMLLAPSNAERKSSWSNRIRRIIFDEVHCIGQAEDGLIWEQLLLLAPCPIIALSATVGNPEDLGAWLRSTQKAIGKEFVTIQHHTRYSDLRKYVYNPPQQFGFSPMKQRKTIAVPGLDNSPAFGFFNPVASLVDRSRGIPEDLAMEARDCYALYKSLSAHQNDNFKLNSNLDPAKALPEVIRKPDILKWEKSLKDVLRQWMKDPKSPFESVLNDLSKTAAQMTVRESNSPLSAAMRRVDTGSISSTTLPLLLDLHEKDALPAILFNYDRYYCEKIAKTVMSELQNAEDSWKSESTIWQKKLAAYQEWKDMQEKAASKAKKAPSAKQKGKKQKNDEDGGGDNEDQNDNFDDQSTPMASFDPTAPVDGFHFADWRHLLPSEFDEYRKELSWRGVPAWLVEALTRGIGVHHAGMNRKYRQVVEMLFRKGFLKVVVATGTLALGINMPCKTVVFSGDSVFLTALNFRQAAGRAGRRGFDVLGNVVFQGISFNKVCRLLSSRLPDLNGHFPITTSLVLRLCTLLHETKNCDFATKAVNGLLSQPRLYLGGTEAKMTVLHHLRFSIEYLRRQSLLAANGAPLNFAGLVSHLYYTENSGFAFHALLKGGYFHEICADVDKRPKDVLHELMVTMAHLFGREPCRQADEEFIEEVVKRSSSIVFLPPMPKAAEVMLREHNAETLSIYRTYVATFVDQHIKDPDRQLPLSRLAIGPDEEANTVSVPGCSTPVRLRSPFVALSGHGDEFKSIHDLCHTVRSGVFLEENVIPHVTLYPQESDAPLNAYLLDFFKHGDVKQLQVANRIQPGNVWFMLNDFSMVLATIVTSLTNFIKAGGDDDLDMSDVRGSGDVAEELAGESKANGKATADDDDEDKSDNATDISLPSWTADGGAGLPHVLKAFEMLKDEFNEKFKAMWA